MVTMSAPSACTASTVQLFTDSPFMWMVQAPHDEVSQPMLVPVSPTLSRMWCTSNVRGSTSSSCLVPFTVIEICKGHPPFRRVLAYSHDVADRESLAHRAPGPPPKSGEVGPQRKPGDAVVG